MRTAPCQCSSCENCEIDEVELIVMMKYKYIHALILVIITLPNNYCCLNAIVRLLRKDVM